ncbi:MAG: tol-pal system protein YbgF [Rhodoferax sp.]|nr:tol-pal system protein YbgF [Rhodoferax sp.]
MSASHLSSVCRVLRFGAICLALTSWMGAANAGLFDDEEARKAILDLRQKMQESNLRLEEETRRASDDTAQLRRSLLDLQNQLDVVRTEAAKLRGQNEQMARDLADVQRQQKDTSQNVDERLRKFEPSRVSVDGREFLAEPLERRDFEAAMGVFRKGDFAPSQLAFVEFLNRYPKTGYRQSALFWLGNAQYATRDYKDALASFRALVAIGGDHVRVPEAALAIANCQLEMKDTKGARKTLEELSTNFPSSEAAQVARDRLARLR